MTFVSQCCLSQSNLSVDYLIDIGDFTVMNLVASFFKVLLA